MCLLFSSARQARLRARKHVLGMFYLLVTYRNPASFCSVTVRLIEVARNFSTVLQVHLMQHERLCSFALTLLKTGKNDLLNFLRISSIILWDTNEILDRENPIIINAPKVFILLMVSWIRVYLQEEKINANWKWASRFWVLYKLYTNFSIWRKH